MMRVTCDSESGETIVQCGGCGEEMFYSYQPLQNPETYGEYVEQCVVDATKRHVCAPAAERA